jgi:hypothetical protein
MLPPGAAPLASLTSSTASTHLCHGRSKLFALQEEPWCSLRGPARVQQLPAALAPLPSPTPVRLPPGCARPATRPACTGSLPVLKTMRIAAVAALAASAAAVVEATYHDDLWAHTIGCQIPLPPILGNSLATGLPRRVHCWAFAGDCKFPNRILRLKLHAPDQEPRVAITPVGSCAIIGE